MMAARVMKVTVVILGSFRLGVWAASAPAPAAASSGSTGSGWTWAGACNDEPELDLCDYTGHCPDDPEVDLCDFTGHCPDDAEVDLCDAVTTTTPAPTPAPAGVPSLFTGTISFTAANIDKSMIIAAATPAIATHFGLAVGDVSHVTATNGTRRLVEAPLRKLSGTDTHWTVGFTLSVTQSNEASITSIVATASTTAFTTAMKAELTNLGVPESDVNSLTITAFTADKVTATIIANVTTSTVEPSYFILEANGATRSQSFSALALLLAASLGGRGDRFSAGTLLLLPLAFNALSVAEAATAAVGAVTGTCGSMKDMYKMAGCCGMPDKTFPFQVVPKPGKRLFETNICAGKKPVDGNAPGDGYFNNIQCTLGTGVQQALEQAGANVTKGYVGGLDAAGRTPILTNYLAAGLCPVNVHWHLGAEHLSVGEFDETGTGPTNDIVADPAGGNGRRLASNVSVRLGFRCKKYNPNDAKFTTPYDWKHCSSMMIGETYEVHWPHSAAGACGTPYQYQSPFYDGVFCKDGIISLAPLNTFEKIGVQSQTFTIVNDEDYYYPDLMRGMIVDGAYGADIGKYTGSTTGTSRTNAICSRYTPITWQVDRKCHLISASSFDKMCADMKTQSDDMSTDLHPHGSRHLVADAFAANNLQRRMQKHA